MKISAWDLVQPECRLPASDRHFLHKRHNAHVLAVRAVKPSIDNKAPPKAMGANSVKVALKQEEIDRTNQLLFTKLSNMQRGRSLDPGKSVSTVASSQSTTGVEKLRALARENSLMRRRIDTVKSGLRACDQQKDFARHEKYLKQISKVRAVSLGPTLHAGDSPPSLLPLREGVSHTVSSGWSVELWGEASNVNIA